ncbi:MAG: LytTR family DNA-binding domain-containing protein [Pseudomonadota bacterium]
MIKPTTTAIIADDEQVLRAYLKRLLAIVWPELHIVAEAENGLQALEFVNQYRPDIIFLDIKMPGLNGLEVAAKLQGLCHIVFSTAYDDYAIDAFETEVVDYLIKPVTEERLIKTTKRIQQKLELLPDNIVNMLRLLQTQSSNQSWLKWVRASVKDEVHLIAVGDIIYFKSDDKYTSVITQEREYIIRTTLKDLEQQLDPEMFWRVHRSCLVHVAKIESSKKDDSGNMILHLHGCKDEVSVSRNFQYLFKAT